MRDLFANLAPSTIGGRNNEVVTYTTPVSTADLCSGATAITVPLNGKKSRGILLSLATRTTPPAGKTVGVADGHLLTLKLRVDSARAAGTEEGHSISRKARQTPLALL